MKKVFLLLVLLLLPWLVSAAVKIDGIYYNLFPETNEAEVKSMYPRFYTSDIIIPTTIIYEDNEYSVTSIGNGAFYKCAELTSVIIPNSVTSIGKNIFDGCIALVSLVVEEGNPKYDSRENCNAIIETASNKLLFGCQNTIIPNSVASIANSAFNGCSGLTSIIIPDGVTDIGGSAFSGCSGLTSITMGRGVTSIGENAFKDCDNLTKVELNNNAIVSKAYKYESGSSIKDIFGTQVKVYILGEDVMSIGDGAFDSCTNLISVNMSNNVTSIGKHAFSECHGLVSIHISDNLTSIGELAFYNCYHLASINIPASLTSIDLWAFSGCGGIKKVEINSNAIVSKDYHQISSLANYFGHYVEEFVLGEEVTSIGQYAFSGCVQLSTINIPNHMTNIGEGAFFDCPALTSINIPSTVTSIGENAFYNCNGLLSIQVEDGNTVYDSRDNCNALIRTADNTLMFGCQNTVIPNSVTSIGDNAFYCCAGLISISIPNSVTHIGYCAFCGCTGLTTISIPNSVTSIGQYAFASCNGLASVNIANSVTTIDDYAFAFCLNLTSITIPNSVTHIGYRAFSGCSGLTAIQVESGNTVYDSREDCNAIIETANNTLVQGCQNTIIPNSVTVIGAYAFDHCAGLTSVTIPNSVTTIGKCAFIYCTGLTSITIPNGVTSIEDNAFTDCYDLATVIIPNSVTNIGDGVFLRCSNLKDVYCYAEQVPKSGGNIFENSYFRSTLHVPAGSIDAYRNAEQWKDFASIVALTDDDPKPTGIKEVGFDAMFSHRYYSVDGKRIATPQRGLYIIKMNDGKTKKVVAK